MGIAGLTIGWYTPSRQQPLARSEPAMMIQLLNENEEKILEAMIEKHGLASVLYSVAGIAAAKGRAVGQFDAFAKESRQWEINARKIDRLATYVEDKYI